MKGFEPYPQYKDSGVEWLGEIPEEWRLVPLKYNLRLVTEKSGGHPNTIALENIESWSGRFVETDSEFTSDGVLFASGDILFGKLRPYLAKAYLTTSEGAAVGDFHVLHPMPSTVGEFAQYQILNYQFIDMIDSSTYGAKMPRVSWDFMGNVALATPPTLEQLQIARFLDHETGKIDGLIAEQEKLIELLKEKRQATISHAVTKGLNPNAPMKDSGVEWLGEVPEHWKIINLRWLAALKSGDAITTQDIEMSGTYPVYGGNGIRGYTEQSNANGDFVLIGRQGALCGNINYASGEFWASEHAVLVYPHQPVVTRWLGETLRAMDLNQYSVSAAQPGLAVDRISSLATPVPPIEEQAAIAEYLDHETAKLDALLTEAERGIELLKERRSALISAAVTGKIDVRNWKPQGDAA